MSSTGPNEPSNEVKRAFEKLVLVEGHSQVIRLEGDKKDQGKPPLGLIPSDFLFELGRVLDFGAKKYDSHNWRKGIKWSRMIDASLRHIASWKEGEDLDAESGLSHLAHAACCLAFLVSYEKRRPEFDDRYKQLITKKVSDNVETKTARRTDNSEVTSGEGSKKNDS